MLFLDKSQKTLTVLLNDPARFEYDLDFILAASTLCNALTVFVTPETLDMINAHPIHAKQFAGLAEFGVHPIIKKPTDSELKNIFKLTDPNLINYDELVDCVVKSGATHTWY